MRESVAAVTANRQSVSPEDTEAFGVQLAAHRPRRDDGFAVVYLTGDLGAGKTTLARGFLRAIGVVGTVRSPTYTLLETYEAAGVTVVHLDLYRLQDASELEALGLRDLALPNHVWLVEWPERGEGGLPPPDLRISLAVSKTGGVEARHVIDARGTSAYGNAWLARLQPA